MLTPSEIDLYNEQGYLVFERLINGQKLNDYLEVFDALVERARQYDESDPHFSIELDQDEKPVPGLLHKVQGVCVVESRVLDLAKETDITDRVASLIGPDLEVFGTKFFPKLVGGTSTHWHQDTFYFGTTASEIISCGIYLQDADEENGCLQVVPGSHTTGTIAEHVRDPTTHGSWTEVDTAQAVALPVPAGTVVLFSANLLHGTEDNRSPRTRYSTAWHYCPTGLEMSEALQKTEDRFVVRTA
jgi:ectoine hydroxylase-related dioxygenase (phytanoyl-CoA dioxygenase family)